MEGNMPIKGVPRDDYRKHKKHKKMGKDYVDYLKDQAKHDLSGYYSKVHEHISSGRSFKNFVRYDKIDDSDL